MSTPGACILGVESTRLSDQERAFFQAARPFGFILFARNIESPDQMRALCNELRDATGQNAPILIDQEGGRVQRLRGPVWREWLPPLEQVMLAGDRAEEAMYARYRIIAHELFDLGVDANCAPLVDIAGPDTHSFLKSRCYGDNPDRVEAVGRAVARGLAEGGVLPVVKHVPGHGRATVDSHLDLPVVETDAETLDACDFAPFRALSDQPMAMTAHLVFSAMDERPVTLSPVMIDFIRTTLSVDSLLMTDDISMQALQGEVGDLSAQSIEAGCDVVLHCNGNLDEMRQVAYRAGTLQGDALRRAEAVHAARQPVQEVDIPALEAKLAGLLSGAGHD
ncbi:MAG: glycoside hydrolase family 3 N-terminal domain-containing protein [Pseudomonadota bacterium]